MTEHDVLARLKRIRVRDWDELNDQARVLLLRCIKAKKKDVEDDTHTAPRRPTA